MVLSLASVPGNFERGQAFDTAVKILLGTPTSYMEHLVRVLAPPLSIEFPALGCLTPMCETRIELQVLGLGLAWSGLS